MKKGILKFLAGTTAIAMLVGGMALSIQAADTDGSTDQPTATEVTSEYYSGLTNQDESPLGTPSLTLAKYRKNGEEEPIEGVEFRYAKVGALYQITDGKEISMAYGLGTEFAEKFGIDNDDADYHFGSGQEERYYYKDLGKINTEYLQKINVQTGSDELKKYIGGSAFQSGQTGANGTLSISNATYGVYAIVEWSSADAKINGKEVSLTNIQSPFLVALPTFIKDGNYWNEKVTVRVKNSSNEPTVEKKIVTENKTLMTGEEAVDDTDITSIGDTVYFRLKGTVPTIPTIDNGKKQTFGKYILEDVLSKGLTPATKTTASGIQLDDVVVKTSDDGSLLESGDYTTKVEDYNGTEPEYKGGKKITISLTDSGLTKISNWAADTEYSGDKEIRFYYTATVNDEAVIGPNTQIDKPAGNPNKVKLQYKIGTSKDMETDWDKVTEYTFGIKADKQLAGSAVAVTDSNKNAITFALYSTKDGNAETTDRTYYEMKKVSDGVYHVTSKTETSAENNTKMHPAAGGALNIKGLEEGTYFLEELTTVSGYNLLKAPVKIKITAKTGNNTYVLDGKEKNNNQYIGTISQDDNTDGIFKVTINNIKGFELPYTGGNGIWFFVLAGAFVVAAGCGYYSLTIRKNRAK